MKNEIKEIEKDLEFVKNIYIKLLTILPSFNITDRKILPYGLKAHTRSVSWLVEQVITQQTKYNAKKLGLDDVNFDFPDTSLHDCEIIYKGKSYFVNVKIHNIEGKENKNDISAVEKLYFQYSVNKNYTLIYACFGIKFENIKISFVKDYLEIFSPQFLPIYVNPRNDKIQATYRHDKVYRTREEFLKMLKEKSKSIILK
ncbi:MAG: hypothetical protein Athens071412_705 [Parcubacteria group bacterium Athens0714_12]|nr:MAG: hypothetical protein Athens071412_705 [Parcubacteria group bacterium Athens0714_12]